MSTTLQQLRAMTTVVADTGDILAIRKFAPTDATTNPSLLLKAAGLPEYQALLENTVAESMQNGQLNLQEASDALAVAIGSEILNIIPGYISTEVDARLSFDTPATVAKARSLIARYEAAGWSRDRILIKIASTWEGIQAARILEQEGIHCNLTLLFGFAQAVACAEAGVTLISPFVGRILDWYKGKHPQQDFSGDNDPGVQSVTRIYHYYKQHDYSTIIMGASFRNTGEIKSLAGCDRLTISPALLEELEASSDELPRRLQPIGEHPTEPKLSLDEKRFRWMMNEDAMATEKLAEGIRNFTIDQIALEKLLLSKAGK
ncbi:MAG: transaldolase [Gammaproteobacteria bacterium]